MAVNEFGYVYVAAAVVSDHAHHTVVMAWYPSFPRQQHPWPQLRVLSQDPQGRPMVHIDGDLREGDPAAALGASFEGTFRRDVFLELEEALPWQEAVSLVDWANDIGAIRVVLPPCDARNVYTELEDAAGRVWL